MTILNTEIVNYLSMGSLIAALISIIGIIASTFIVYKCDEDWADIAGFFVFLFSCLLLGIGLFILPKEQYTKYEVLLNEEYSAKELIENYEFIEQHGDIYILRDKQ